MQGRILVADDEPGIVSFIKKYLEHEGYEVLTAGNGKKAIELSSQHPDLILLDIMMPGLDGLSVCREIRDEVDCPIVFITAKVEEADRVLGFSAGADDYIVKPFGIAELTARVNAHLRRERRMRGLVPRRSFGAITIDYQKRSLWCCEVEINLPRKEYEVLELLSLHPGQTFSRGQIFENIWGLDNESDDSVVYEQVKRLRARLAEYTTDNLIETVWGVGYRWIRR